MHHKVCLVDTVPKLANFNRKRSSTYTVRNANNKKVIKLPRQGVLMTGSMNWTLQVSMEYEIVVFRVRR